MYTGGRFTITGGGPDIWGLVDGFHFVYQPWSGDGEIFARVAQFEYGARCSKACVMFRETLDPASVNVTASLEIDNLIPGQDVLCVHHRAATEDTSSTLCHIAPYRAPQWIRLVRQGNVFRASVSPDGATWVAACADTLPMARDVFVGLSVTSHDTTKLSTAVFEGVEVR
jgi:regulation of enolase protein 1 (concanavalin A-like superfamily)